MASFINANNNNNDINNSVSDTAVKITFGLHTCNIYKIHNELNYKHTHTHMYVATWKQCCLKDGFGKDLRAVFQHVGILHFIY